MKLTDIEDAEQLVTKDYLNAKLAELRQSLAELETRMTDRLIASERGQRLWIWGLYALIIVSFFVHK